MMPWEQPEAPLTLESNANSICLTTATCVTDIDIVISRREFQPGAHAQGDIM